MATIVNQSTTEKHACSAIRRASFSSLLACLPLPVCQQCQQMQARYCITRFESGHRTYVQVCSFCHTFHLPTFRAWLVARAARVVGTSASESACPLAHYLTETTGTPYHVDTDHCYPENARARRILLPAWAVVFIRSLDCAYPLEQVTGAQALDLLSASL